MEDCCGKKKSNSAWQPAKEKSETNGGCCGGNACTEIPDAVATGRVHDDAGHSIHGNAHEHQHAHRDDAKCDHDHGHGHASHSEAAEALPALAALTQSSSVGGLVRTQMRILQMDCPTEEALIRKKLDGMAEVSEMQFNLMQRVLTVVHRPDGLQAVVKALSTLGFTPELGDEGVAGTRTPAPVRKPWWPLAIAVAAALGAELASWLGSPVWAVAALALLAVACAGIETYKKGWVAVRNLNLNINALMSIAVTGALALGQWPEAAMVMVLFTIAELIEAKSLDRARNAIEGLMNLAPETATVKQADGSWVDIDATRVELGAIVRVRPGERIALDGALTDGRSTVNQASITGESMPVEKGPGDNVFAGTINESGSFEFQVTAAANNSTLARIIHAVEEAQGAKAPTQRFVDQFAKVYTPIVFLLALGVAIVPPLFFAGAWFDWVYKALVLLVIACPCALVISTPVSIVSGLAAAARKGILIKGGTFLEQGRRLRWLALDKTGTITHGKPVQVAFELRATDLESMFVRSIAASLSSRSDHPVSTAITRAGDTDGLARLSVEEFEAIPGRGIAGRVDGRRYSLGNHRLVEELGRCSPELEAQLETYERDGKTVVMLADNKRVLGLFVVADTVKDTSREAILELHALGVRTAMLTGDNGHTAAAIAKVVGIDRAEGDQLPEDKLRVVESLLSDHAMVGMVGDGINDAPALARADIGFAMGAMGTDTAIETADVALMDDDLRKIPAFIRLSKATRTILVQNITLALGIKAIFLALTIGGLGTMWMAVFADVGASLLVVANGLRLLRK
ncbi:heavy metal translocating P-type ATPase [Caballeronia novacaledonica]|uniref:heavy metal translocating P-type ATPase n=1 Tax=Caballeronia novacaledonica TaxID=1544861 RepID=UPI0038575888